MSLKDLAALIGVIFQCSWVPGGDRKADVLAVEKEPDLALLRLTNYTTDIGKIKGLTGKPRLRLAKDLPQNGEIRFLYLIFNKKENILLMM